MRRNTVLIISHDPTRSGPLLALLRGKRYWPVVLDRTDQIASLIADENLALIVLHGDLPFCSQLLRSFDEIRESQTLPPFFVVAVNSSESFAIKALRSGARDYFVDPLELSEFADSVSKWLPPAPQNDAVEGLTGGEVLVGNTPGMQALRVNIRRIAATDCNVLITGETGTGKELVAQLIHQNSSRAKYPLVSINCAAIPDSLLESELFGYERGAFTGAHATSPGKLMTADKGTVFFDEIGDMSPCAQAKILRAIEAKELQRLGANRRYQTDVRILAATHHDLDDLASTPTFRRDLYFRLNVGRIHLSPLRERKADIPNLVQVMISELNRKVRCHIEGISDEGAQCLARYDWPGNVRELKNVIERVFIVRERGWITAEDVSRLMQPQRLLPVRVPDSDELCSLREALTICNGNKSKAAETLNWSRMTLYRKMAKYGMGLEDRTLSIHERRGIVESRKRA